MSVELARRAAAMRAYNKGKESYRGTGYHDEDKDWRGRLCAPQNNGLPRIGEHLVPFHDDHTVTFAGEDAEKVLAAMHAWHDRTTEGELPYDNGSRMKMLRLIPKQEVKDGLLVLWKTEWNDFLMVIYEQGIGLSGAPLIPDGTTPE